MEVKYINHMSSDLGVVNAARVSFAKQSVPLRYDENVEVGDHTVDIPVLDQRDQKLIGYLARGCTTDEWNDLVWEVWSNSSDYNFHWRKDIEETLHHVSKMPVHWAPFAHPQVSFYLKVPIFVARQLDKHQVGMVTSEVSRRYVIDDPEFYTPSYWREKAPNVKQGSSDVEVKTLRMQGFGEQSVHDGVFKHQMYSLDLYRDMLDAGVCPEQARMVLPQSMYTEYRKTGSLYAWANLCIQRGDSHAQREIQEVAKMIGEYMNKLFPYSWKELVK